MTFANLLGLGSRKARPEYEKSFVESVRIREGVTRNRRTERLLVFGWIFVLLKCAAVAWAVHHYRMPFNPLWVIAPTLSFAALVTAVYVWRD
jgi:hypothetical protein